MPVTNYHTLNGELLGETGPGGRRFYGKDALGSVVATYDQNGTLENTYRYKPYGGLLSKTGSAPDPRFMWTGSTGSRTTGASYAEQYNRARHYGSRQAGWTSVDPLWPGLPAYEYALSAPTAYTDASGLDCAGWLRDIVDYPLPPIGGIIAQRKYCDECQSGWCWCRGTVEHRQVLHGWISVTPSIAGTPCQYRITMHNREVLDPALETACPGNCRCRNNVPHCSNVTGHFSYPVNWSHAHNIFGFTVTLSLKGHVWVSHKNELDLLECG